MKKRFFFESFPVLILSWKNLFLSCFYRLQLFLKKYKIEDTLRFLGTLNIAAGYYEGDLFMNTFQFIGQYIKRHKVQYTLGIITLFVVDFANIFIPKLTGVITDGLTAHSLDWSGVKLNLLYLFLLGLLLAVGRFFWRYFLFGASRSIEKELRNDMFAHLEKMDVEYWLFGYF
jgi:hypothetical protein